MMIVLARCAKEKIMQSKKQSHRKAQANGLIGIMVGFIAMRIMIPILENLDENTQALIIVSVMFVLSYSRNYLIRRLFNISEEK